uniref:Peroxiredoxin-5 n=1 Tax=Ursus maritimus TaxID=29073 RepID=A0A452T659_URSMA
MKPSHSQVGDAIPSVVVFEGEPGNKVNLAELFKGKKGVLFGVPGAFTPGCSKTHLPGFVEQADALKAKGVQVIACLSVNDVFVTAEWGRAHNSGGKVLHGGRGRHSEVLECGAGWYRPHLQPGPQHPLAALRPWACYSFYPFLFHLPSPGQRAQSSLNGGHQVGIVTKFLQ